MRYVLIFGSRSIPLGLVWRHVGAHLEGLAPATTVVITGGASGVDETAEEVARDCGIHCATVNALWEKHGRPAGPIRNQVMADMIERLRGSALGLWDGKSKGTQDMYKRLAKAAVHVDMITVA